MNTSIYTYNASPNNDAREAQHSSCARLASELGLKVEHDYHDESGSRASLHKLLAAATSDDVATVIVSSQDRFGRSPQENSRVLKTLLDAEVQVYEAKYDAKGGGASLTLVSAVMQSFVSAAEAKPHRLARGMRPLGRI